MDDVLSRLEEVHDCATQILSCIFDGAKFARVVVLSGYNRKAEEFTEELFRLKEAREGLSKHRHIFRYFTAISNEVVSLGDCIPLCPSYHEMMDLLGGAVLDDVCKDLFEMHILDGSPSDSYYYQIDLAPARNVFYRRIKIKPKEKWRYFPAIEGNSLFKRSKTFTPWKRPDSPPAQYPPSNYNWLPPRGAVLREIGRVAENFLHSLKRNGIITINGMEILFDEANRISVKLEQEYARAKNAIPNREPEKPAVPTDVTAQVRGNSKNLGSIAESILLYLFREKVFDAASRMIGEDIAVGIKGKNYSGNNIKRQLSDLRKRGYLQTQIGPGGGNWLTSLGKSEAAKQ